MTKHVQAFVGAVLVGGWFKARAWYFSLFVLFSLLSYLIFIFLVILSHANCFFPILIYARFPLLFYHLAFVSRYFIFIYVVYTRIYCNISRCSCCFWIWFNGTRAKLLWRQKSALLPYCFLYEYTYIGMHIQEH